MKRNIFALFLGVLSFGFANKAFAQPNPFFTGVNPMLSTTNSVTFSQGTGAVGTTGNFNTTVAANPPFGGNNSAINIFTGNIVTLFAANGQAYIFAIVPSPSANPSIQLEGFAEQFLQVFFPNLTINGQSTGDALQLVNLDRIPFDFGLSAVLGAGALAAVRTARKRKAEQAKEVA